MFYKIFNYITICVFFIMLYTLFSIKNMVDMLTYQVTLIEKQIIQEKNTLHILEAEFAFLTSPERLKKLSEKYLKLIPIQINQIIKDPSLNTNTNSIKKNRRQYIKKDNTQWRYKKCPIKYLQKTSDYKQ